MSMKRCDYMYRVIHGIKGWRLIATLCALLLYYPTYASTQKVNLSLEKVSIEQFIKTLKKQTNVEFLYHVKDIQNQAPVTIE